MDGQAGYTGPKPSAPPNFLNFKPLAAGAHAR